MIVTIDGPAGSGKSTAARNLANKLGFIHLNSGALFRAVGLKARDSGVPLDEDDQVAAVAAGIDFRFEVVEEQGERFTRLFVDGTDIAARLKGDEAGALASRIGVLPRLREVLTAVQRRVAETGSLVLEGRDAGTVVFPESDVKFYLDASIDVRAARRYQELAAAGLAGRVSFAEVKRDMETRDCREMTREAAPLRKAPGAVVVDTSELTIDEVVEKLRCEVEKVQRQRGITA